MELQKLFFYLKKAPELWGKKMEKNIEMSGMINGFIQKKKEKKVLAKSLEYSGSSGTWDMHILDSTLEGVNRGD